MRELKFRAWFEKENRWLHNYRDGGGCHILGEIIIFGEWMSEITGDLENLNHVIIEQYTGLKDAKGVEIYEGDILGGSIGLSVFWCDKCRGWQLMDVDNECYSCSGDVSFNEYEPEEMIVTGNIHENPELLEGGTK